MINRLYNDFLHNRTRHTNMEIPGSRYITANIFPEQNSDLLNTEVTLKYRNCYVIDDYNNPSSGRPQDDPIINRKKKDPEYTGEYGKFIIVRADNAEPYRLIAISKDYKIILVNSTRKNDLDEYEFINNISEYSIQNNTYFASELQDQYYEDDKELRGVPIRVDAGEPCYCVIVEFLEDSDYIRFVLGDEVLSVVEDIYGYSNNKIDWSNKYKAEFVKNLIEGKIIYGTV